MSVMVTVGRATACRADSAARSAHTSTGERAAASRAGGALADLEAGLLEDGRALLERWRREFAGRPAAGRERLLLLALEPGQIVAAPHPGGAGGGPGAPAGGGRPPPAPDLA